MSDGTQGVTDPDCSGRWRETGLELCPCSGLSLDSSCCRSDLSTVSQERARGSPSRELQADALCCLFSCPDASLGGQGYPSGCCGRLQANFPHSSPGTAATARGSLLRLTEVASAPSPSFSRSGKGQFQKQHLTDSERQACLHSVPGASSQGRVHRIAAQAVPQQPCSVSVGRWWRHFGRENENPKGWTLQSTAYC